jgi:lipooligosaccharide transport system ATP-binding protein
MSEPIVELRGVAKHFGARVAVASLDLDVARGTCFGMLGPNGAGKTTTMRMIYGATRPTRGTVRVFGIDVARQPRAVRARLGVALQENVLIEELSPVDNLRIAGRFHLIDERELARRIEEVLDFLELRSHASVPVAALSGGFQRRLSIAMALISRPELLILDEPTTGLDPAVRLAVWARVRELRARGTTVLLTTHYMEEAERLCDRVAILAAGHVVADGSPRALIEDRLAREAVELDCPPGEEGALLGEAAAAVTRLRADGRLMLYSDDAGALAARIRASDRGQRCGLIVRPTNLEDVFLATTGTRLGEGA